MSGFEAALDGIGALAFGVAVARPDAGVAVSGVAAAVRDDEQDSAVSNTSMPVLCFLTIIVLLRTCTGGL
ncbi:hypothetical protein A6V36_35085 [Paraburkholderia ginsengiterrae]|uniref:Uncharacterized protein n=1 Tax=Paraburkholderia ginsengiterrae TaxID=1462993 RepID=A0A1A9MZ94_9BURK|nr:hypothetical protein A6V37_08140 [Paraburkholderia ginsengiterrae]OAJ55452.1 hypothetical protein A6V36_35085 [Paraburkholderia ginsengiterrae]